MDEAQTKPVPRMRPPSGIIRELRKLDPGSEISEHWVRWVIKAGAIPVVHAGCKHLVNLDDVLDLLRQGTSREEAEPDTVGGIRRIDAGRPM